MKRKVIKHGPATLTVSLPRSWVRQSGIRKGDELNVEVEGSLLKVYPGIAHMEPKRIQADFSGLGESGVHSILSVLHKSGYDEIDVHVSSKEGMKAVQERVNTFLHGYEIIEQTSKGCVVRSISSDQPSEIDTLLRRCFLVAISLARSSMEALEAGEAAKLSDALALETTSNRLSNYCERLINKSPYKDEKSIYRYLVVWVLESICDDYRDLIRHELAEARSGRKKPSNAALELYKASLHLLEEYYGFFYHYKAESVEKLRYKVSRFKKLIIDSGLKHDESVFALCLSSVAGRVNDLFGATIGLNS